MAFIGVAGCVKGARGSRQVSGRTRPSRICLAATKDEVMELILSKDNFDRLEGVNKARELEPMDSLNALSITSVDPDLNVRYATASQLAVAGQADPQKALELMRHLMDKETDGSVRAAVADSMCALGIPEAFDDVKTVFEESTDLMVRFSILAALGELGNPKAFDLLKDTLEKEEDGLLKVAALGALGELGDERAIEVVKPFLSSDDPTLKERAQVALDSLSASS